MKRCNNCNKNYLEDMKFCTICGSKLKNVSNFKYDLEKTTNTVIEKKNIILTVFRYTVGILFMWLGLLKFFQFSGIIMFLCGLFLLPITYIVIFYIKNEKVTNFFAKYNYLLKILLPSTFFIIWLIIPHQENLKYLLIFDNDAIIGVNNFYEIQYRSNLKHPTKYKFKYYSSDETIATVKNGVVYGLNEGKVTITMKGKSGIERSVNYIVKYIQPESIELSGDNKLCINCNGKLYANVLPLNASEKKLEWSSSDSNIISVDNNGNLVALSKGEVTITAKAINGISNSIKLKSYDNIDSIHISADSDSVEQGKTLKLNVSISPSNAEIESLKWRSTNEKIAIVNNGTVTGISSGTTTIIAESLNGVKNEFEITVYEIKAETIVLNKTTAELHTGNTLQLQASIMPYNTTNKTIKWTTSNATVATVDDNGKVTAVGIGSAIIKATTSNYLTAETKLIIKEIAPIKITYFNFDKDILCGVQWHIKIKNTSNKEIDSVRITWDNYNAYGLSTYERYDNSKSTAIFILGPWSPNQTSKEFVNSYRYYSCEYTFSSFQKVEVYYTDGTEQIILKSQFESYDAIY